jgi:hypothetical protein
MARLKVEGFTENINYGTIPNTTAVVLVEGSDDPEVAFRHAAGEFSSIVHDAGPGVIFNRDSITHTFQYFLRGTGVPGGEVDLTPLYTTLLLDEALTKASLAMPLLLPLLEGQHIDVEMQEVIGTLAPTFNLSFRDVVLQKNDLLTAGKRITQLLHVITDAAPVTLEGADETFSERVLYANLTPFSHYLWNGGTAAIDVSVTLTGPDGSIVVNAAAALAAGALLPFPSALVLREGYSLTITNATADQPLVWFGAYTDMI